MLTDCSFHCLFCHGYEQHGSESSGVLAIDDMAPAPFAFHVARSASQLTKTVTLYTHGNEDHAALLKEAAGSTAPFTFDHRKITKFTLGPKNIGVTLTFEDGSTRDEAFIAHKPKCVLKSPGLAEQLGCELTPQGDIKTSPPFGETTVLGCFAAGDNSSSFKTAPGALSVGGLAAAGIASHVQSRKYGQKSLGEHLRSGAPKPA
jgi:thioredoxin reductase